MRLQQRLVLEPLSQSDHYLTSSPRLRLHHAALPPLSRGSPSLANIRIPQHLPRRSGAVPCCSVTICQCSATVPRCLLARSLCAFSSASSGTQLPHISLQTLLPFKPFMFSFFILFFSTLFRVWGKEPSRAPLSLLLDGSGDPLLCSTHWHGRFFLDKSIWLIQYTREQAVPFGQTQIA